MTHFFVPGARVLCTHDTHARTWPWLIACKGSPNQGPSRNESVSSRSTKSNSFSTCKSASGGPEKNRHMWRYPKPYPKSLSVGSNPEPSGKRPCHSGGAKSWKRKSSPLMSPLPTFAWRATVWFVVKKSCNTSTGYLRRHRFPRAFRNSARLAPRSNASRSSAQHRYTMAPLGADGSSTDGMAAPKLLRSGA
jgi:hypothetical protein